MGERWHESLRPFCADVGSGGALPFGVDAVVFYLARWCQKKLGESPRIESLDDVDVRVTGGRISRHLADDGERVDRLWLGDREALTHLRGLLMASARSRVGDAAHEFADEALQKIAVVLLTGTPPSKAAERLRGGPRGPRNEYIFTSPFSNWARTILINLVIDEHRRAKRRARIEPGIASRPLPPLDAPTLQSAKEALPGLIDAIRGLPRAQRTIMVASLCRSELDETIVECFQQIAPDLFSSQPRHDSDRGIADHLGTTARLVAANRSAARRKLSRRDATWALLLDVLLPHKSTKPLDAPGAERP